MAAKSSAGSSCFTRWPRPGRLATTTVGSGHTSWPKCMSAGTVAFRPTCPRTACEEIARTVAMARLYHVALRQRTALGNAPVGEARQIDGAEGAVHDQFGDRAPGRGTLLCAMPGEAAGEVEVGERRVRADDRVLVEPIVVVVTRPGVHGLDALEHRHTRRQPGPHHAVEEGVIDLFEVGGGRLLAFLRRLAAKEEAPLRAKPHARRIDGQRTKAQRWGGLAAIDDVDEALARLDREVEAGQRRQLPGPRPGRVDERPARKAGAARKPHGLDALSHFDARHPVMQQHDAL